MIVTISFFLSQAFCRMMVFEESLLRCKKPRYTFVEVVFQFKFTSQMP